MAWVAWVSAAEARERISAALDAIDAAHDVLRETPSDLVGSDFRVDVAARLETQERTNRGLMYRVFGEIADPPDETGFVPVVRDKLWARLRITPAEITRRFKLAARIRPRRSLTGPPLPAELPALAAAVEAGDVGEDHIAAVCRAVDVLPASVSPTDVARCRAPTGRACGQRRRQSRGEAGSTDRRLPQSRWSVHRRGPGSAPRAAHGPTGTRRHVPPERADRSRGPRVLRSHRGRGAARPPSAGWRGQPTRAARQSHACTALPRRIQVGYGKRHRLRAARCSPWPSGDGDRYHHTGRTEPSGARRHRPRGPHARAGAGPAVALDCRWRI